MGKEGGREGGINVGRGGGSGERGVEFGLPAARVNQCRLQAGDMDTLCIA